MADEITKCDKILNEDDSIKQYDFSYRLEESGKVNTFCVTVLASEMTTPSSEAEAKTKANVKAAAIKTAWLAQEETTSEEVASVIGGVTL
jgi:hypothetical protein